MPPNSIDAGLVEIEGYASTSGFKRVGGAFRGGGTTVGYNMVVVGLETPTTMSNSSNRQITDTMILATGFSNTIHHAISGDITIGTPNDFRKGVEVNLDNPLGLTNIQHHASTGIRELTTVGYSMLRNGTWINGSGIAQSVLNTTTQDIVTVAGSGDQANLSARRTGQSYFYRLGLDGVEKTLPVRTQ